MTVDSESGLIRRCLAGEEEAWNRLFEENYGAMAGFVFQMGPDLSREDVEEICQEAFLSVVRNLGTFRGSSRLQTWIMRIAANKARDFRERMMTAKRGGGRAPLSLQAEDPQTGLRLDPPSSRPSPDAVLEAEEEGVLIRESLDELGDPCREIIELRYFADLSYEEIGGALRLNVKTVSSRLSKCLDKLEAVARARVSRESSSRFAV